MSHCTLIFILVIVFVRTTHEVCDTYESCIGQTLNDSGQTTINGYNAASGAMTSFSGGSIVCQATSSCDSMAFIHAKSGGVECEGSRACANTIIQSNSTIYCDAAHSCINSKILPSAQLNCGGSRSCENTTIIGVTRVRSYGILALYKAIIDTINSTASVIDIFLSAHLAAFGALFICRESHECHIYCQNIDACDMFYIDCNYINATCFIHRSKKHYRTPILNSSKFFDLSYNDLTVYQSFDFDMIRLESDTNALCIMDKWTFDDNYAHSKKDNITVTKHDKGPICCRGYASCQYVGVIEYKTQTKKELICSAHRACRGSRIQNMKDTVFCEGSSSCYESVIDYAPIVTCSAYTSCKEAVITGTTNIICSATLSCSRTTVISGGNDVHIFAVAYRAAHAITLYCNDTDECVLHCNAFKSCDGHSDMLFVCDGNCSVRCYSNEYCPVITSSNGSVIPIIPSLYPTFVPLFNVTNVSFPALFNVSVSSSTSYYTTFYNSFYSTFIQIERKPKKSDNKTVIIVIVVSSVINILAIYYARRYYLKQKEAKKEVQQLSRIMKQQQMSAKNAINKSIHIVTHSTKSISDMVAEDDPDNENEEYEEDDEMESSDTDSLYVKDGDNDDSKQQANTTTGTGREEAYHEEGEMDEEGTAAAPEPEPEPGQMKYNERKHNEDEAEDKHNEGRRTINTLKTDDIKIQVDIADV